MLGNLLLATIRNIYQITLLPVLLILAVLARFFRKKVDVGLGPEPLINNIYHKAALVKAGYTAETFVTHVYYITSDFDKKYYLKETIPLVFRKIWRLIAPEISFIVSIFRYRILYIYFHGGSLGVAPGLLWLIEPFLYKLANTKVVVMPYGGDVQEMSRSPNLLFKHAISLDYPVHRTRRKIISNKIDLWTKRADHVVSGVEWVDYMYHWDTLMLGHFSIDTDIIRPRTQNSARKYSKPLKVLHAPNHREIKGTQLLLDAIEELEKEGIKIDLTVVSGLPNREIIEKIQNTDLVADQFIVGWYAMFALEAMAAGKPVLCYLREDLIKFYENVGLVEPGEIPLVNTDARIIKDTLKYYNENRHLLQDIGMRSRDYVVKHHSLESVGRIWREINSGLGVESSDDKII